MKYHPFIAPNLPRLSAKFSFLLAIPFLLGSASTPTLSTVAAPFTFHKTASPLQLLSAVSRKTHGGSGTFDIDLPCGTPAIECRGAPSQIVFTFDTAVTFTSASVTAGTGSVSSTSGSGTTTVTVNLTGVTNAQRITLTLFDVNNGTTTANLAVQMGVLLGDTNGDGVVNSDDTMQTQNRVGQPTDGTNFRSDVNVNGIINTADVAIVHVNEGMFLADAVRGDPAPPGSPPQTVDPSGTSISLTEGNLSESQRIGGTGGETSGSASSCGAGQAASSSTHGISFDVTYNSRDADNSHAQFNTVMGNGWTHSFNTFLFSQAGSMFRSNGAGRFTRYTPGPGNSFIADTGYFETLVSNPNGTFTLTQKDRTQFTFASVPGTPCSVGDAVYRLTQILDRNNDLATLTYSAGNLMSVTDTYGRAMTFTYDAHQHITSVTDPLGRSTAFTYDAGGTKLTTITDPLGKTISYTYNGLFQLTSKTDKDGRLFSYVYTGGKPTGSQDDVGLNFSLSNPTNWATDPTGAYVPSTTTKTDGRGNLWRYQYDSRGYVTQVTAPDGAITQCTYDPATRMVASVTDANNHTTQYEYDAQGNRNRITLAAPFNYVTTFTYEPTFNTMTSTTDPKGRVTTFTNDAQGNRIMETDPLLQTRQWTYDSHGNVLTETDKRGKTTTYTYDAAGNRNSITAPAPLGYVTTMTYDSVGNLRTRTDPNNHTTMYDYDGLNRLIKQTDPSGNFDQYAYDDQGNRIQMIDRDNHSTFFEYDQRQRLIKTTDALGQMTTSTYDLNNNRITTTDKNGHTTTYGHDVQNRLNTTTDAVGNVSTMIYDPYGNVISSTDANLHTATYNYDELNRRSTLTDAIGYVTMFEYDMGGSGCGTCGATPGSSLITKQTDGNGKVTYYKYDQLDRLVKIVRKEGDTADVIDASDAVTSYAYDPSNNRLSMTEPNGNITTYDYDALNRGTAETNAAGDVKHHTYDGVRNLITMTAPNGNVTTITYDPLDRIAQMDDSVDRVASFTYDNVGNRLTQADGNNNTTSYAYDAINRPTIVTDPLTQTTVTQYDAVGKVINITDREGHISTNTYDNINRQTSSTDALGHTTQYQYDAVGKVVRITDANGHATQYEFDGINRLITETYADAPPNMRTYTYDAVNVISRTDQKNQTTIYTYNDLYFLLNRTYPVSAADNFNYDLSGRMLGAERGGWTVTLAYDGANRVTQTAQNNKTIAYVYDIPGRTRTVHYPGGRSIVEQMDFRRRLATIDDTASSLPILQLPIVQYSYDLGNRVATRAYRNGTIATYSYNANNWVTSLEHSMGVTRIAGFGYDFDKEGNKKSEQKLHDPAHSETYQYDSIYRLTDYQVGSPSKAMTVATQTTYNLDPVGNWNSKTTDGVTQVRMHNPANELTNIDATDLIYDDNGNLQDDGTYTYAYDEENRLTRVTRNSDSIIVAQYQYDALGRRVKKIGKPTTNTADVTHVRFFYDGSRIIEEQQAGGATQATYTYGNYADEVLTMDRGAQTYYYHQNSQWSVEAVTNAAFSVVERYSYGAYGQPNVSNSSGVSIPPNSWDTPHSAIGNPYLFTGRQLDEETGGYFYRARYFDTPKGRFITRDRIGIWGDPANLGNGYTYVGNNPATFTDPFGLAAGDPIPGVDVSLDQVPGGIAAPSTGATGIVVGDPHMGGAANVAAAGDPIPGVDVSLDQVPGGIAAPSSKGGSVKPHTGGAGVVIGDPCMGGCVVVGDPHMGGAANVVVGDPQMGGAASFNIGNPCHWANPPSYCSATPPKAMAVGGGSCNGRDPTGILTGRGEGASSFIWFPPMGGNPPSWLTDRDAER